MTRTLILCVGLCLTGCFSSKLGEIPGRAQIGEEPGADFDAFATVGSRTQVGNTEGIPVSGVGLVYRLPGTGSSAPPGSWRSMLENSLKKQGFNHLKELLDDPGRTTSLVLVSTLIPPGARKGDPVDIQITLPDESKTTSLKGGVLMMCELMNYDTTGNIASVVHKGETSRPNGSLVLGSPWVRAEGPIVAGTFVADGKSEVDTHSAGYRVGRVWAGGRVLESRPYYFIMNAADTNIRSAAEVAARLNGTFHATVDANSKVATAQTKELVMVSVPSAYRHNHFRYLLVARQVPIAPVASDSLYRLELEEQLMDPSTALTAAIKLEALGGDCHRSLRVGLESPSPWVRFAAAESLAYLGHTDGTLELAKLAEDHPALRAHCLKALASMDDAASTDRLAELMNNPEGNLRYGAFIALRLADENHSAARGVLMNNSFWLHRVAPGSPAAVHLSSDRRSEIVLFGNGHTLRGPFTLPAGTDFTISVAAGTDTAKVTRIVKVKGEQQVREVLCAATLPEVLATMAKLGSGYTEAVDLLKRADQAQVMSAAVVEDAIPRELNVQQLSGFAKIDPTMAKANVEVARVGVLKSDLSLVGYDLPGDHEPEVKAAELPPKPPLSREPGRIFGSKRPAEPALDPNAPLVPGL